MEVPRFWIVVLILVVFFTLIGMAIAVVKLV